MSELSSRSDVQKIETFIKSIAKISVDPPADDVIVPNHSTGSYIGSGASREEVCEEKRKLTQDFESIVAFDPNAGVLYPGALIKGNSLPSGTLVPIGIVKNGRSPLKVTVTGLASSDPATSFSRVVQSPDAGTVADAVTQILAQHLNTEQPARATYSKTEVFSLEQALLRLDVSYSWLFGHVNGSFQTSNSVTKSSYLVRFVQNYYTVSVEPPSSPASYLTSKVKYKDFANYAGPSNPPTYVSSVTYGRELFLLAESYASDSDLSATLDAAVGSGSTNLTVKQREILNQSDLQVLVLGGGGTPAVKVLTGDKVQGINDYLKDGANYSQHSPGTVISYVVRYLIDNDVARVSSATDYTIQTLRPSPVETLTDIIFSLNTGDDDKDDDNHVSILFALQPANTVLYRDPDIRPRQPDDNDPTWHDHDRKSINFKVPTEVSVDNPNARSIDIVISKSGDAHWHFGFDLLAKFSNGQIVPIASYGENANNFGDHYNSNSWRFGIPWSPSSKAFKRERLIGLLRAFDTIQTASLPNLPSEIAKPVPPKSDQLRRIYDLYLDGTWQRETINKEGSTWEVGKWKNHPLSGDAKHIEEISENKTWVSVRETRYD